MAFFVAATGYFAMLFKPHETATVVAQVRSFTRTKRRAGGPSKSSTSCCYEVEVHTSRGVESVTIYDSDSLFPPKLGTKLEVARVLVRPVEYKPGYFTDMGISMSAWGLLFLGMSFAGQAAPPADMMWRRRPPGNGGGDLEPKPPGRRD